MRSNQVRLGLDSLDGSFQLEDRVLLAPVIYNAVGDFRDGGQVALTGVFPSVGPQVVIFDNFDGGQNGAPIRTGTGSATVGSWSSLNGQIAYSSVDSFSGGLAARANMAASWSNNVTALLPGGTRDIYVSYVTLIPSGTRWPGEGNPDGINWKTVWVMGQDSKHNDRTLPSHFTPPGSTATDPTQHSLFGNNSPTVPYFDSSITRGRWLQTSVWVQGRTDNTGALQLWEVTPSGVQEKVNRTGVPTLYGSDSSGTAFERIVLNGYGRQTTNSFPTFDDFYVAVGPNAQTRVEIGNMPTYTACTLLAITTPTSWSNSKITTTIRQGAFRPGQTAYLFVVGPDGVVSEHGYPITIGATPPLPTLRIGDVQVTEGNGGTTPAIFTLSLSAASNQPVTVSYSTANGSALSGQDYSASSGTLTFNPGETSKTITIQVKGDTLVEPNETFLVNLSNPTNATIADGQGIGTILNDDNAPPSAASKLAVASVSASSNDGNVPANTLDGNLSTRWSAKGDGQWIQYDLGSIAIVDRLQIAFYLGDQRTQAFDIQVSRDGSSWSTVFTGKSSGTTTGLQTFPVGDVQARYVRIVGHGNSQSAWNSLTEVAIWGWPSSKLAVASVSASSNDGNVPANTLDGNLSTRWSAKGDGQWIQYDLGNIATVDRLQIAFYLGDQRTQAFDIQVSRDGSSWSTVFTGKSSGTTTGLQTFPVGDVHARYVRIVGHGNSQSAWNSLTEVAIWGWPWTI